MSSLEAERKRLNWATKSVAIGLVVVVLAFAALSAVQRITELTSGQAIGVTVPLSADQADAVGAAGAESMIVTVATPSTVTLLALGADVVWVFFAAAAGMALAARFYFEIANKRLLGPLSPKLLAGGAVVLLVWWIGHTALTYVGLRQARALLFDNPSDNTLGPIDPWGFLWSVSLASVAVVFAVVFHRGRDRQFGS